MSSCVPGRSDTVVSNTIGTRCRTLAPELYGKAGQGRKESCMDKVIWEGVYRFTRQAKQETDRGQEAVRRHKGFHIERQSAKRYLRVGRSV